MRSRCPLSGYALNLIPFFIVIFLPEQILIYDACIVPTSHTGIVQEKQRIDFSMSEGRGFTLQAITGQASGSGLDKSAPIPGKQNIRPGRLLLNNRFFLIYEIFIYQESKLGFPWYMTLPGLPRQ